MSVEEKFKAVYDEVFDTNGDVRACGREQCKKLITIAKKIDAANYYGSTITGIMNIASIKELKDSLNS